MKKLVLLICVAAIYLCGCKKENVTPPDPYVPPTQTKTICVTGHFDFEPFSTVHLEGLSIIFSRTGMDINSGVVLYNPSFPGGSPDFVINLDKSLDSLKGKTYEVAAIIGYTNNGTSYSAEIIQPVTFQGDTVKMGNIGFQNYDWTLVPHLVCVILPSGQKFYQ